ncbi:Gfo/Idh/MocA family oxidoreductase [Lysinibacillus sp. FSL M8-0216]|uniref:Gfo/Idh/MocA family oxidoreductase n=1 Tax=Lysinibacillus TaxID=400634 RepID=UPI00315A6DB1
MKKIGILGVSEGNGHPYSFSAIINGYDDENFKKAKWDVIYNYIRKRDISEIGFANTKVTHVWTQSIEISEILAKACKIENIVESYQDMICEVDAIIIARDDYENHYEMAKPFLEAGLKVFVDKPLTLDIQELLWFKPYIEKGQLMSMSGMRYAIELDGVRADLDQYGQLKFIQSNVINGWEKYGIHLLDAILGIVKERPMSIEYVSGSYMINFESGLVWTINVLGDVTKTFNINIWGEKQRETFEINDNFSMFRRTLWRFEQLVLNGRMMYDAKDSIFTLCLLIAGRTSKKEQRKVFLNEFSDILK